MGLQGDLTRSEAVDHFCSRTDFVIRWRGFAVTPLMAWALDMNAKRKFNQLNVELGDNGNITGYREIRGDG